MLKVKVANNMTYKDIIVPGNTTVKECFAQAGISMARATICLDGRNLSVADTNKTLDELGCAGDVSVMAIIKNDNAR